jgi:hypothetical protein
LSGRRDFGSGHAFPYPDVQHNMRKLELSPYYPVRARWYSPLFRLAATFRRIVWLDRIHLPEGISSWSFIAALLLPGLAFWVRCERLIGGAVMGVYALLALVFVIWLGYPAANIAFGLMLSLHATSILFLCSPWLAEARLVFRLLIGLGVLVAVGGLLYAPLRVHGLERWLMPLRVNGRVVIVQTFSSAQSVQRGDWIAYRIEGAGGYGWRMQSGFGLRPVLAAAGDRVRFTTNRIEVNGVPHPRQPHMPVEGGFVVPENHWFIWPELAINLQGNGAVATADAAMLGLSNVAQAQFVGKPLHRWLWRRQILQ